MGGEKDETYGDYNCKVTSNRSFVRFAQSRRNRTTVIVFCFPRIRRSIAFAREKKKEPSFDASMRALKETKPRSSVL